MRPPRWAYGSFIGLPERRVHADTRENFLSQNIAVFRIGGSMADQVAPISTGKRIAFTVVALVVAAVYFHYLDILLMDMQGLDYLYMFRK